MHDSYTVKRQDRDPTDARLGPPASPVEADPAVESPALRPRAGGGKRACELKFLIDERRALQIEEALRPVFSPDPHSDPRLGGAYLIHSLYCDNPALDVYHRVGEHRYRKFRIRRYGVSDEVFLERKTRRGIRVRKRRVAINLCELARLGLESSEPATGSDGGSDGGAEIGAEIENVRLGDPFRRELALRGLRPVCEIAYLRRAFIGICSEGPLRLTFDRDVRGARASGWGFPEPISGTPIFAGSDAVVCEFKYLGTQGGSLPAAFKRVLHDLALTPSGASKYRRCMLALGLVGTKEGGDA